MAASTIRALLENERYVGHWVWNKRKWVKVPGKKNKRCILRPRNEWIEREAPELAVVDQTIWDAVRQRFIARRSIGRARAHGESKTPHLLSGLLRCGVCGSSMNIVGSKKKAGAQYFHFGCSARQTRGASVCANSVSCSERKAEEAIMGALRDVLDRPEFSARFVAAFNAKLALKTARPKDEAAVQLNAQISEVEVRVRNLGQAVARSGWSETLAEKLKAEEATLRTLKGRLTKGALVKDRTAQTLTTEIVQGYLRDLVSLLGKDVVRGRLLLKKHLGAVVMTPNVKGSKRFYTATSAFDLRTIVSLKTFDPAPTSEDRVSVESSCGGRI